MLLVTMIGLGTSSCALVKRGQVSFREWKEQRDQRQAERELAKAEKEAGLTDDSLFAEAPQPPVFLDYDNPDAATAAGTRAEGNRGEGWTVSGEVGSAELPGSVGELTNSFGAAGGGSTEPVFSYRAEDESAAGAVRPPLDPELIRAWAGSIAQVTGASLSEPMVTAMLHASVGEPEPAAVAATTEPISLRRSTAAAFAGQESTGLRTSEHEADWSTRQ